MQYSVYTTSPYMYHYCTYVQRYFSGTGLVARLQRVMHSKHSDRATELDVVSQAFAPNAGLAAYLVLDAVTGEIVGLGSDLDLELTSCALDNVATVVG